MSASIKPELAIQIGKVKRTRKRIEIDWGQGDAAFVLRERDNPLPSFNVSFDALSPVVAAICHFPEDYCLTNLRIVGIVMGEMSGTKTVSIIARKTLDDAAKEFAFTTPARLLANPTEPGTYTPPLSPEHAELVAEAEEQAKLYIRGERAQGQMSLEDEDDPDGEGDETATDPLPFEHPEAAEEKPEAKPKRTRKPKAEPAGVH